MTRGTTRTRIALTTLLCLFLAACGGGDGDKVDISDAYTGNTSGVVLTAENFEQVVLDAYLGGDSQVEIAVIPLSADRQGGEPLPLSLAGVLEEALREMNLGGPESLDLLPGDATIYGDCGDGYADWEADINPLNWKVEGTIDFYDYCSEGVTISGPADFWGDIDPLSREMDLTMAFPALSVEADGEEVTVQGNVGMDFEVELDGRTEGKIKMDLVLEDESTGKTYWLSDYKVEEKERATFYEVRMGGRYYDHDAGYIDFETLDPLEIFFEDDQPSEGQVKFSGGEGTWALLDFESDGHYRIEMSDGTVETGTL
ncbi:hypothetical protein [uncultured Desulfuromonas sp.]|uniref:hypothetical protein n=1 Tax=uncultured Desulfuromonas sp. TaxID=181013 RepID=UPI00261CA613|nr:hypothetical protein [uncultured Desulfuromonas sp.]